MLARHFLDCEVICNKLFSNGLNVKTTEKFMNMRTSFNVPLLFLQMTLCLLDQLLVNMPSCYCLIITIDPASTQLRKTYPNTLLFSRLRCSLLLLGQCFSMDDFLPLKKDLRQ